MAHECLAHWAIVPLDMKNYQRREANMEGGREGEEYNLGQVKRREVQAEGEILVWILIFLNCWYIAGVETANMHELV